MDRPLVLLANDDGYSAQGLQTFRQILQASVDVVVCAPSTEQSSSSHALSLNRPLRLTQVESGVFHVDGTPADCVYVALNAGKRVLPRTPDLVVSGINHGLNLGNDVFYSGTVAAAREGALRGVTAVAFSGTHGTDYLAAAEMGRRMVHEILERPAPHPELLNVNFPKGAQWPVLACHLGSRIYKDGVDFRQDPRGGEYLWLGGQGVSHSGEEGTDTHAHDEGKVSITPLSLELCAYGEYDRAKDLSRALSKP